MRAFTRGAATETQLEVVRELVKLARAEEPNARELVKLDRFADDLAGMTTETPLYMVRRIVGELHIGALPGGALEVAAKAWRALPANGGEG